MPPTTTMRTAEIASALIGLDGWRVREVDDRPRLTKTYPFARFDDAMSFASRVASVAEEEHHHPRLVVQWGKATVEWWSHEAGGLTTEDFALARRTDGLFAERPAPEMDTGTVMPAGTVPDDAETTVQDPPLGPVS